MSSWINPTAIWQILAVGLLAGAGLPALVATGLRALTPPSDASGVAGAGSAGGAGGQGFAAGASRTGVIVAALCFATVLAAIGYGIYLVVQEGH